MEKMKLSIAGTALLSSLVLVGCGGGGGTTTTPAPGPIGGADKEVISTKLSGVAAAGAPLIGQVTVKGALGNTKSALIEADGTYTVDVTGLTAPYRLRAEGSVGGRTYKLHSYAESADLGGTVNITPFTDLIIANAAQQIAESFFDSDTSVSLEPEEIEEQETALQEKLKDVFQALGVSSAIDLLNTTFSADHSGLDAALDVVRVEMNTDTNVATITNLIEQTSISDNVLDDSDNSETLTVSDSSALTTAVTDTQAIAAMFNGLAAKFADGLPKAEDIEDYFAEDFIYEDEPKGLFLTGITTDPDMVGGSFHGFTITEHDSVLNTAKVTFNWGNNGVVEVQPDTWFVAKDAISGQWQLRGDQRIAEVYFSFHCNDHDSTDDFPGACGINTRFWDSDFTNNGTVDDAAIASGKVSIVDGDNGTVKGTIFLGTPEYSSAGDVQVYNESNGQFEGDWKAFGSGVGQIEHTILKAGDIIRYDLFTEALDVSTTSSPQVAAQPVVTYEDVLLFEPSLTMKLPNATSATQTAISNFSLDNNLTVAWSLQDGTRNQEVLVEVGDGQGNRIEIWDWIFGQPATSVTVASTQLSSDAASSAGLDSEATEYNLLVRIYAEDTITGQAHSRDYRATIPGPNAPVQSEEPVDNGNATLNCAYNSGWNEESDQPLTFNSYDDFQTVLSDCGGALPITEADVIGTWIETMGDGSTEKLVLSNDGTLTFFDIANGVEILAETGTWSLDNNLVRVNIGTDFFDIWAAIPGGQKIYSESIGWGSNLATLDDAAEGEIWGASYVKQADTSGLDCSYNSGWNDALDQPVTFNSYADFEEVIADCGVQPLTHADVVGTWVESAGDGSSETFVFNNDGTLTLTDVNNGQAGPAENGTWSVSNNLVTITIGSAFIDIWATTDSGQKIYSEDTAWGSDLSTSNADADEGEIWSANYVKQ